MDRRKKKPNNQVRDEPKYQVKDHRSEKGDLGVTVGTEENVIGSVFDGSGSEREW